MPVTLFDPGGCGCTPTCASPTIGGTVTGCNSLAVAGLTVEAHDATVGGTLMGSTTTNSSGVFSLSGLSPVTSGNAIVIRIVGANGFTDRTISLAYTTGTASASLWGCGKTSALGTLVMTSNIAATHICLSGYTTPTPLCAYPWPRTLNGTHSFFGAFTLNYVAGTVWGGSLSYAYPGCTVGGTTCVGATVAVNFQFQASASVLVCQVRWNTTASFCPTAVGTARGDDHTMTSLTCPPSLSVSGSTSVNGPVAQLMTCSATAPTRTITITP
jgi:hypothetical protein